MAFAPWAIGGRSITELAALMGATAVATKAAVWRARLFVKKRAKVCPALADYLAAAKGAAAAPREEGRR